MKISKNLVQLKRYLHRLGFDLYATVETAVLLQKVGLLMTTLAKANEPGLTTVLSLFFTIGKGK